MRPIHRLFPTLLAAGILAAACSVDTDTVRVQGNAKNASFAKRDSLKPLGPGDIRIATVDSSLEVALVGDSLVAGLGATARAKVKKATDTAAVAQGLGGSIEKLVKSTVAGALDHELHLPLSEVSDVRYENGILVFYGRDGARMHFFERKNSSDRRVTFTPDDAKDFIAIYRFKTGKA